MEESNNPNSALPKWESAVNATARRSESRIGSVAPLAIETSQAESRINQTHEPTPFERAFADLMLKKQVEEAAEHERISPKLSQAETTERLKGQFNTDYSVEIKANKLPENARYGGEVVINEVEIDLTTPTETEVNLHDVAERRYGQPVVAVQREAAPEQQVHPSVREEQEAPVALKSENEPAGAEASQPLVIAQETAPQQNQSAEVVEPVVQMNSDTERPQPELRTSQRFAPQTLSELPHMPSAQTERIVLSSNQHGFKARLEKLVPKRVRNGRTDQTTEQLQVPNEHRLEASAWHTIEIDSKTGKPVEAGSGTFQYGHEFQQERSHEAPKPNDNRDAAAGEVALVAASLQAADTADSNQAPKTPADAWRASQTGQAATQQTQSVPLLKKTVQAVKPVWPLIAGLVIVIILLIITLG